MMGGMKEPRFESALRSIMRVLYVIPIGAFIFLALAEYLKSDLGKYWDMIQLSLVLGALVFAVGSRDVPDALRKNFSRTGFLFLFSGILLLIGLGISVGGIQQHQTMFSLIGSWIPAVSLLLFSATIADLFITALIASFRK
jgi:hypothetical protein